MAWSAVLFVVVGLVLVGATMSLRCAMYSREPRTACLNNLSQLGQILLMEAQEHPGELPKYSGPALFLSWRKDRSEIRRGDERALICPEDDLAHVPETDAEKRAWDDVDLAHPPRSLCSYAVRDFERFPIDPKSGMPQPIAACLHHKGIVVFVDAAGDAQFVKLDELGLASDDEKIVGPGSKSPLLRVLRFGDGSVR
jgi:hypothetical protein